MSFGGFKVMAIVLDAPRNLSVTTLSPPQTSLQAIKRAVVWATEEGVPIQLYNVSWPIYQAAAQAFWGRQNPRFYYEKGNLLIMPNSSKHERSNYYAELFVSTVTEEWEIDCVGLGSTTYQNEELAEGFEPDSCFYFQHEAEMRGKDKLDMATDPPPELIIEIDITSLSTKRQSIYAAFGVPEIWRYDGARAEILRLTDERYMPHDTSLALPLVTAEKLTEFLRLSQSLSRLEWLKQVRAWAREQAAK
jgi:Uma2 family endonuclease